jgi:cystathionine beta-lyase/cystathionine gamma-synthase
MATGRTVPLVPPLYQSSVYRIPDLDVFERINQGNERGFFYVRDRHPNAEFLARQLAAFEGASWVALCGSGMAAITAILLSQVEQGDRIVAGNALHFETAHLLQRGLARYGVQTMFVDVGNLEAVCEALVQPAKLFWVETISNPQLRLADIAALAELCRQCNCRLVVDNTLATPVLVKPLDLGASLVVESLTKMIGGHADVTLGAIGGAGDIDQSEPIHATIGDWGLSSHPFECWLAERGLATLPMRMQAASTTAAALADWLADQAGVERVIYPGRTDHPDYPLARRLLAHGFGNLLCFELAGGREAVNRFMQAAPGIPYCTSMGTTITTCSPAILTRPEVSPAESKRQPFNSGLIRLSVGVEPLGQIQEEIARGLTGKTGGQARSAASETPSGGGSCR